MVTAAYPTQVRAFTDKTDEVDVNYADHVNLLQAEVAAVQTELGTDPAGSYATVAAFLADLNSVKYGSGDTIRAASGTSVTPGLSFASQTGTGFAYENSGVSLANNGARSFLFKTEAIGGDTVDVIEGSDGDEEVRFNQTTNEVQIVAGGVAALDVAATKVTSNTTLSASEYQIGATTVISSGLRALLSGGAGAGAPAVSFTNDTDTGMYRRAVNTLGFATSGSLRATIADDGLSVFGSYLRAGDGTGSTGDDTLLPGLSFRAYTQTGFAAETNSIMHAVAGGHHTMTFYSDRTYSLFPVELSNADRALRFRNASNAGLQIRTAGTGGFSLMGGTSISGPYHVAYVAGDGSSLSPGSDNAVKLGNSAARWSEVWAATGAIKTSSDERLKTDIIDSDLGLEWVLEQRPRRFRMKDYGVRPHYGFVAQEVKQVMDDLDVFDFGGYVDPTKRDNEEGEGYLGLTMDEFIAPLYKGVQDLHGIVEEDRDLLDEARAEIKMLKTEIELLKNA